MPEDLPDDTDSRDVPVTTLLDDVKAHVEALEKRNPTAIKGCLVLLEYSKDYEEDHIENQEGVVRDGPNQFWCSGLMLNEVLALLDSTRVAHLMLMVNSLIDERLGDRGF